MKYIITADHNGVPYYMQFVLPDSPNLPPFVWNGLINNATTFITSASAKKTMGEMFPFSKLPMKKKSISAYGMKANDVFDEEPKPTPPPEPEPPKVNFDALDTFFQKHILFKQPLFAK